MFTSTSAENLSELQYVPRHSSRVQSASAILDWDSVERERLALLCRSRGGYAAQVSRKYTEFVKAVDAGNEYSTLSTFMSGMENAFDSFRLAHDKYVDLAEKLDGPESLEDAGKYFADVEALYMKTSIHMQNLRDEAKINKIKKELDDKVAPEDSVSQQGSSNESTSTARSRIKVAAKKAALQTKLRFLHQQRELEYEQLEVEQKRKEAQLKLEADTARQKRNADLKLRQLQLEADIEAATAEEGVLAQFSENNVMGNSSAHEHVRSSTAHKVRQTRPRSTAGLNPYAAPWNSPTQQANMSGVSDAIVTDRLRRAFRDCLEDIQLSSADVDFHQNDERRQESETKKAWMSRPQEDKYLSQTASPKLHKPVKPEETVQAFNMSTASDSQYMLHRQLLDALTLPKTSLMTFDGDPLKFWIFMNAFDCCVGNTTVDDSAKLNRLLEYCVGNASKVVKPCALMKPSEGYARARKLLQDRFGNQYRISEAWVRKITEGPAITPNNGNALQELSDDVRSCIETLRAMDKLEEVDSRTKMIQILGRLPLYLQGRWRKISVRTLDNTGRYPNIEDLADFLDQTAREMTDPVFGQLENKPNKVKGTRAKGSSFNVQADDVVEDQMKSHGKGKESTPKYGQTQTQEMSKDIKCYACGQGHSLRACKLFAKMPSQEKLETARKHRLCFNCLESRSHGARWCKKTGECGIGGCTAKHSKMLHHALTDKSTQPYRSDHGGSRDTGSKSVGATSLACVPAGGDSRHISLPIVAVRVRVPGVQAYVHTHALLDPGSNKTFCGHTLLSRLGAHGTETRLTLETLSGGTDAKVTRVALEVAPRNKGKHVLLHNVMALEKFPDLSNCGASRADIEKWKHLRGLDLPTDIDVCMLIGQDNPQALMPLEVRRGQDQEPYAVRTVLGWTINGPVAGRESDLADVSTVCAFVQVADNPEARLEAQVQRFWEIESVPNDGNQMSVEDKEVIQEWGQSTKLTNGHYELAIPFREETPKLPDNRAIAEQRLRSLGRRFSRDSKLASMYKSGIEDLIAKGYSEPVKEEDTPTGVVWYLPHHCVKNVNKPDKLRIVFDCAAEHKGTSLNKNVLQGPDLTNKLIGVLLRFRENPVAAVGDIEAMFHQVRVHEIHRDALRFLWWKDGDPREQVEMYRMTCHLFGGVWSPAAATFALRRTAEENANEFPPEVCKIVKENFYVDDCLVSFPDEESAMKNVAQLCQLLTCGGFRLTKWLSNSRRVLNSIPLEERSKLCRDVDLNLDTDLPADRTLGVHWNTTNDQFSINIRQGREPICTRRGLLSLMSSVYDPLGLVGPYILLAKLIFQSECRNTEKGWDDPLEEGNKRLWLTWLDELPELEELCLERCVLPSSFGPVVRAELHHFGDASEKAYGAVSYLRIVNSAGEIHCCFLMAKSKLAPMKGMTIPRLELSAAVICAHLDAVLRKELRMEVTRSVFWSDSTIVLQYIKNKSRRFHTFVANRVAVIHDQSTAQQWNYVDTDRNPADDVSRGLDAQQLVSSRRWLMGPEFLWENETSWPVLPCGIPDLLAENKEVKQETKSCAVAADEKEDLLARIIARYSTWSRLQRAVVWITRLQRYYRKRFLEKTPPAEITGLKGPITLKELDCATKDIVMSVQSSCFKNDVTFDNSGKGLLTPKSSLRNLNPVLEDGLLKVGGRIDRAPVGYEKRHPVILPTKHHVTCLIVEHHHKLAGHSGPTQVLASVREHFWIVRGRAAVRRILGSCLHCRKRNAFKGRQLMAPLPVERLIPDKPPFTYVGVDYFGPLQVKRGRSMVKRYGCLFTCLTTRAVHIEVAHSLELDSFLCALQRFISRRGKPLVMYSDNGTNFHGGERELKESIDAWNQRHLDTHMVQKNIEWHYNPPYASHMGGVWERMIRHTRRILKALVQDQVVSDEALHTFMVEAEKIMNDRPITSISDDVSDPEPLTPSKLLLLRGNESLPLGLFDKNEKYTKRWWRQAQYLANVFWHRWVREYLPLLQERQKWLEPCRNLGTGDLVLVVDENLNRGQWPLGRVVKTYPDDRGHVRSVQVRVGDTLKDRPIHKLVFLEDTKESRLEEAPDSPLDDGSAKDEKPVVAIPPARRLRRRPKRLKDFIVG